MGGAHARAGGRSHPNPTGCRRRHCPQQETYGDVAALGQEGPQHHEHHSHKARQGGVFNPQEGHGPAANLRGNSLHLVRTGVGPVDSSFQKERKSACRHRRRNSESEEQRLSHQSFSFVCGPVPVVVRDWANPLTIMISTGASPRRASARPRFHRLRSMQEIRGGCAQAPATPTEKRAFIA